MTIIQELIRDDYSFEQAEAIQIKYQNLMGKISKKEYITSIKYINIIAGVDISYFKDNNYEYGIACAVIWNLKENLKESYFLTKDLIKFPYKPGFLGFRECKLLAKVISIVPNKPDLILCDGHGKIHPKKFGEAVHLGYALDIPSIGIAKNPFIGFSDWHKIERVKGNKSPIWAKNPKNLDKEELNDLLGYAICLNNGNKPVFVSEGYKISLNLALKICLTTTKNHRQPEPLYLADYLSRKSIKYYN
ncbi:MAG: endonuclease V [Candidatus Odinarchaeota archaeon]